MRQTVIREQVLLMSRVHNIFLGLAGVVIFLLFACATAAGQSASAFPQDQIIEKVASVANPEQSYTLFLPPGYTPEKKWPILYAFDPLGRGSVPVKLFQEAARQFGWILVGSNNSRNGIDIGPIVKELWADTHARFSIDERRVYTTGFSGGARVAGAVALSYRGAVAGVIAASGGPPPNFNVSAAVQLSFFGTAGTDDFNFPEMQQLKRRMDEVGVTNRLVIFEGGHEWPPAEAAGEAITWMEVQAMKSGTRARDDKLIDERLAAKTKKARDDEAAKELFAAYREYGDLVTEFKNLRDIAEFAGLVERLSNAKEIKAAIKSERAEEENQASLSEKLRSLVTKLQDETIYTETMSELKFNLSDLTKKSEGAKEIPERRVARRVLQSLLVQIYEEAFSLKQKKNYGLIPAKFELATLIKPKDPRVFYELAAAYARVGNKSRATAALVKAIDRGFTDVTRIEENEDFVTVRNDADFRKVIAGLKKS
jgi:predicted esterase